MRDANRCGLNLTALRTCRCPVGQAASSCKERALLHPESPNVVGTCSSGFPLHVTLGLHTWPPPPPPCPLETMRVACAKVARSVAASGFRSLSSCSTGGSLHWTLRFVHHHPPQPTLWRLPPPRRLCPCSLSQPQPGMPRRAEDDKEHNEVAPCQKCSRQQAISQWHIHALHNS